MDYRYILGLYEDNGKEHGNYHSILGLYYIGIMEKKMETAVAYWGYIWMMQNMGLSALAALSAATCLV